MVKVSVVMPSFNKHPEIGYVLQAFCEQSLPRDAYEIIVVDDGSTDATVATAGAFSEALQLKLFQLERRSDDTSQAYPARNIGVRAARGELVVIMDPDIIPSRQFLAEHIACHRTSSNLAVLGFTYAVSLSPQLWRDLVPDGDSWDFRCRDDLFTRGSQHPGIKDQREERFAAVGYDVMSLPLPWTYCWSHNLSVSRELLLMIGLFDETFRRSGDFDLGYRLFQHGARFVFSRGAKAFHYPHPRDYGEDLVFDRQGEYYLLGKFPTREVETLVAFGCYAASPNYPLVALAAQTIQEARNCLEFCAETYDSLDALAVDELVLFLGGPEVEVGLVVPEVQVQAASPALAHLLGVALPFDDKSLSSVIVGDYWRLLPEKILHALLAEVSRTSRSVSLLLNPWVAVGDSTAQALRRLQTAPFTFTSRHTASGLEVLEITTNQTQSMQGMGLVEMQNAKAAWCMYMR